MTIFNREQEEQQIIQFLMDNYDKKRSGLMYLCGHPGTGKTSLLN
jgi:Cdc6-like AAA superfamily ATPase